MPDDRRVGESSSRTSDFVIPHSRPHVGTEEAHAAAAVVESGQLAQGPRVKSLETDFASFLQICAPQEDPAAHALAVSSGTAALFVALRALDIGAGDEVLIPAYACTSLNQAVRHAGATPCYVDCDPLTLNPDPDDARAKVRAATAACIVPHLFGLPADIQPFVDLGLPVVEDCAQTLGVDLDGRPVGSFGHATVCSFYATKLVAAGEGGMVLSPDAALISEAAGLRDCEDRRANPHAFNFKMTDVHAAVASVQLARLPGFLSRRRQLAERYIEALQVAPVDLPGQLPDRGHSWFRFPVRLRGQKLDEIIEGCRRRGLVCARPVGKLAARVEAEISELPGCRQAWEQTCSVPLYPSLRDEEADQVLARFTAAVAEVSK